MNVFRKPLVRVLLAGLGLVFAAIFSVLAQDAPPYTDANGTTYNQTAKVEEQEPGVALALTKSAIAAFANVLKVANESINSIRGNAALMEYGQRLTILLTGIVILWGIAKNIALKQSLPQLLGDLVFPLIVASFVLGAGLPKLPGVIESSVTSIAGLFGAGTTSNLETSLATNMLESASRVWDADKADAGILSTLTAPLSTFAILLLRIGVIFLILVGAGLGVAAILVAKFQMALAVALAPILIPWIVFKPTEFLFSGWLNFFLKSGFGLVGVFAVSAVVVKGSQSMTTLISNTSSDLAGVMTFVVMAAMTVIFIYLMLKGADIGEGIISGGATGIGQLNTVARGAAATSPARMAAASAKAVSGAANVASAAKAGKALQGGGRLSDAQAENARRRFGSGTLARTVFEKSREGPASSTPKGKS